MSAQSAEEVRPQWSLSWDEGYEAGKKAAAETAEAEVRRLKAELRRLHGQFRLALDNGKKLLNDGPECGPR